VDEDRDGNWEWMKSRLYVHHYLGYRIANQHKYGRSRCGNTRIMRSSGGIIHVASSYEAKKAIDLRLWLSIPAVVLQPVAAAVHEQFHEMQMLSL